MKYLTLLAILCSTSLLAFAQSPLEKKIAARHTILISDTWGAGHRIVFDFDGLKGWVIEPEKAASGKPWIWTMQWMGAFLDRTTAPDLVRRGWYHVHLEAFDYRCNDECLPKLAAFQDYLVRDLGLAPKANLIGMSWGGFYSVRYANAYPQNVQRIYLDAPLLNLGDGFTRFRGPWEQSKPANDDWANDPRMPVNMAPAIAAAKIPVFLFYGGQDQTVWPSKNCEPFAARFKAAGGNLTMEKRECYGHHPHGCEAWEKDKLLNFFDPREDK